VSEPVGDSAEPGGWSAENLRKEGLHPATVIDVGAGSGTPALYRAFPEAHHVLIEPLGEFEPALRERLAKWSGELLRTAVGESPGEATLYVNSRRPVMSSLLQTASGQPQAEGVTEHRRVSVTTVDALLEEHSWQPPFGLKIDTEGTEDMVVKGAGRLLEQTQFVIAEVWAVSPFEGGYTFGEFVSLMESLGFELRDVLEVRRSRMTRELMYADALFRPSAGAGGPSSAQT